MTEEVLEHAQPQEEGGESGDTVLSEGLQELQDKILSLLETTPYITRSMIQVGLGPALPPKLWSPLLDVLVDQSKILIEETATIGAGGRSTIKRVYHLPSFPYPPLSKSLEVLNRYLEAEGLTDGDGYQLVAYDNTNAVP